MKTSLVLFCGLLFACGSKSDGGGHAAHEKLTDLAPSQDATPADPGPTQTGDPQAMAPESPAVIAGKAVKPTKYPIVFHHGFMGSSKLGYGPTKDRLELRGFKAYLTDVSPANSIAVRSAQLATEIDQILKKSGAEKVNIVAHSMGGLDARYLISTLKYGDRIASLVTISTPHHGTPLADKALDRGPKSQAMMAALVNMMGSTIAGNEAAKNNDALAAAHDLTVDFVTNSFNPANPDDAHVYYQSWGALSGPGSGDTLKTLMLPGWLMLTAIAGPNDGVVPTESAHWGEYKSDLIADHLDLIGQHLMDIRGSFDPDGFYDTLADDLADRGF